MIQTKKFATFDNILTCNYKPTIQTIATELCGSNVVAIDNFMKCIDAQQKQIKHIRNNEQKTIMDLTLDSDDDHIIDKTAIYCSIESRTTNC